MSDDERDYSESEEEQEVAPKKEPEQPKIPEAEQPKMTEAELAMEEKMKKKKEEEEILWQEYLEQRQKQKQKEEEELRKLKERQAKRKTQRAEEEKRLIQIKKKQEEQRVRELEEKKAREAEAKKKRLEEAERKRQAMQKALEKKTVEPIQRNFIITKREGELSSTLGHTGLDKMYARSDMVKSREQIEEEKKVAMSIRIKPLQIEGLGVQDLRQKAQELWERLVVLESEKYDLEERKKRQDYDLKELSERQRQINRNKALKKGMDPDALQGKYPPKIQVASKYERRIDRRTFVDKKGLFEGGIAVQNETSLAQMWEERMSAFKDRGESKLPKWDPSMPKVKEVGASGKDEEEDLDLGPPPTFGGVDSTSAGNEEEEEEEEDEEE